MSSKTDSITSAEWARLQQVFDRAIELPEGERTLFIEEACGDDAALKNQVEALLFAAESDEELVGSLISSAAHVALNKNQTMPKQIGTFRVVDELGKGGMGVVYLAQRDDDEYQQQVAIKILHEGLANEEMERRFLAERQILADLNHPNIARLLDGGHTPDGQPYLVMEYIDGEPIIEYCDQHRLNVEARLDLFKQVCAAVAAAHRSLIVHRDIKPNNILVNSDGIPKLLDFGIAKVLNNRLQDIDLAKTQLGDRLLTPDNASPEQVLGRSITTASDIYSLGVLLYQLLCGSRPFRLLGCTPAQMERIICDEVPKPPSQAIGSLVEYSESAKEHTAKRRGTSVAKLRNRLRGDLDNITLMALKKEPQRRYVSASQFGSDVNRHLKGQPVIAAKDTRRYRARKFIARNLVAVVIATVFVAALSIFSVATYFKNIEIANEKQYSDKAVEFLTDVLQSGDPAQLQKEEPLARDFLDVGASRISEQLVDQPELRATLQRIIGVAYDNLGDADLALEHLMSSLQTRQQLYGDSHPYVADVLQNLGKHYFWRNDWPKADEYYRRSLSIYRNRVSARFFADNKVKLQVSVQKVLGDLALLEKEWGKWDSALEHLEEALNIVSNINRFSEYNDDHAKILGTLGALHRSLGNFELSEFYIVRALSISKRQYGDAHTTVAEYTLNLATTAHSMGDLDRAENLYREALKIFESVYDDDAYQVVLAKVSLGRILYDRGLLDQAAVMYSQAVATNRRTIGDTHFEVGFDMVELAKVYTELGQFEQAKELFEEAAQIYTKTIGQDNPYYGEALRQHGNLMIRMGEPETGMSMLQSAIEILQRSSGDNHWQTAASQSEKAEAHIAMGETEEAEAILISSIPILEKTLGKDHRLSLAANERLIRVRQLLQASADN